MTPLIGLGIQALGMGASIVQGIKASKEKRDAERAAEAALNEAKKILSVNRLEGVQVPLSAYNEAFKAGVAQQQQALTALSESDPRALAAGVGKIQGASADQAETTRQAMEQAIYDRDLKVAEAQKNIDENLAALSLEEAAGAQQAAMQSGQQAAAAFSGAVGAAGNIGQNIYETSALYGNKEKPGMAADTIINSGYPSSMNKGQMTQKISDMNLSNMIMNKTISGEYNPFGLQAKTFGLQMPKTGLIQLPDFTKLRTINTQ